MTKHSEVWLHIESGELYEHFYGAFGYCLVRTDTSAKGVGHIPFTNWSDWIKRTVFYFNDCEGYNPSLYINLGEL